MKNYKSETKSNPKSAKTNKRKSTIIMFKGGNPFLIQSFRKEVEFEKYETEHWKNRKKIMETPVLEKKKTNKVKMKNPFKMKVLDFFRSLKNCI